MARRAPLPLDETEQKEFRESGFADLLVEINGRVYNREDCHTCTICRRAVLEDTNEYSECETCAPPPLVNAAEFPGDGGDD